MYPRVRPQGRSFGRDHHGLCALFPGKTKADHPQSGDDRGVDPHWFGDANRRGEGKTIAARRAGVTQLLFPDENRKDYEELDESITEGITPYFVKNFDEVLKIGFRNLNQ